MVHRLFVGMVARRWGKRKTSDRSVVGGWMDSGSKRTMGWAVHGNLSGNGWQEEIDGNPRDRGGFISSIDNGGGAYEFRGLGDVFPSGNTSAFCPRCLHPSPVARFVPKVILAMLAIMCMHGEIRPSLLHMNGVAIAPPAWGEYFKQFKTSCLENKEDKGGECCFLEFVQCAQ